MTTNPTRLLKLSRPAFDASTWHDDVNNNMAKLDAAMQSLGVYTNMQGLWENSRLYVVDDKVIDEATNQVWVCEVEHTSRASGDFADDVSANPTYWRAITSGAQNKGQWETATEYYANDYVTDGGRFGVVVGVYTSGASYDADVTSGDILTLIDTSAFSSLEDSVNAATEKTTLVGADRLLLTDSADTYTLKYITWTNIAVELDALYQPLSAVLSEYAAVDPTAAGLALLDDVNAAAQLVTLGFTASVTELNYTAGVTSPIQTQIDAIPTVPEAIDAATDEAFADTGHLTARKADGSLLKRSWANVKALLKTYFDTLYEPIGGGVGIEVGTVLDYAGTSAPSGYLFCFGQNVSRTTYSALFAVLDTAYGTGDGSTTFGLPDLRGRAIAGKDNMGGTSANRLTGLSGGLNGDTLGAVGGVETHTLTTAQLAAHTHGITARSSSGSGSLDANGQDGSPITLSTSSAGSGDVHNNVQPTFILNKIIYTGV